MNKFSDLYFSSFIEFKIDTYIITRNLYENLETRDVTTTESFSDNKASTTIQHSVSGSINELILQ